MWLSVPGTTSFPSSAVLFISRRPRRRSSPLFPYTTLFRSEPGQVLGVRLGVGEHQVRGAEARAIEPGERARGRPAGRRSEEHTSELQSRSDLVCRLLLEKKKPHITLLYIASNIKHCDQL